jgi:hypothetical protein
LLADALPRALNVLQSTSVECYEGVLVKREDLCCPAPGPPFSKMRGVITHLAARPEQLFGVLDTYHSKAGWAVAYAASLLGKRSINFWPRYKGEVEGEIRYAQQKSQELGAELVAIPAGRSAILYHRVRKLLAGSGAYLVPNALKLEESTEETANEVLRTDFTGIRSLVVSASSATIAAGVLKGLAKLRLRPQVFIHLGYSRSEAAVCQLLQRTAPGFPEALVSIIDEGYEYSDQARGALKAPFPCNEFYDLKAWQWLKTKQWPSRSVMFWNIGS